MRRLTAIIALLSIVFFASCSKSEETMKMSITSFVFRAANNPELDEDIAGTINGTDINIKMTDVEDVSALVPTFEGVFDKVYWNGKIQYSGKSKIDFAGKTQLVLHDDKGNLKTYNVYVSSANLVPKVEIWTDKPVTTKTDFVNARISISNCAYAPNLEATGKIRGRGNATWYSYPKKSYKFKLDEGAEVVGFPQNRDWVLLAEYCDKSLMRTTYMNEMSKIANVDWTPSSMHVDFYLNGSYNGTYLLIEQVEKGKHRLQIDDDGFLIEKDNYYNQEPLYFKSYKNYYYTFKYPEPAEEGGIFLNDENYDYIKSLMDAFEVALYSNNFKDEVGGYRDYIDVDSFAKWFVVMEVLDTQDPNFFFMLPRRGAKLKMCPLWDAEWTLGLASAGPNGWITYPNPPYYTFDKEYWRPQYYFGRLFSDPYFVERVYKIWQTVKGRLPNVRKKVAAEAEFIKKSQKKNFERWDILGKYVSVDLVAFDTWEEEVEYCDEWLTKRVNWFDPYITDLYNKSR